MDISSLSKDELKAFISTPEGMRLATKLLAKVEEEKPIEEKSYMRALHRQQRDFVLNKDKRRAALCSRRAGKTEGICAWLLEGTEDSPGEVSVYIALSRNNARMAAWTTFERIEQRHKLGLKFKERDNQLWVYMPNGHRIWLAGCKDSAEIEKFRGQRYRRVVIDEAASYGEFLEPLIEDVIDPALVDLNGDLALIGTPGAIPAGYFYKITTGDGQVKWPTFEWNLLSNPYIQTPPEELRDEFKRSMVEGYVNVRGHEWLEEKKLRNGWKEDHPTYQREYLGKWVRDEGALVYPYDSRKNSFYDLPEGKWYYGLGIDCGYEDSSAFVIGAWRRGHPEIYLLHSEARGHMIPSAMAAYVERLKQDYKFSRTVIDAGGLGKAYQVEMSNRYGIFCEPAKKTNKRAYIEIVRGELLSGTIKVHPRKCGGLLDEWDRLVWNEDRTEPDDRFQDHQSDAALYLIREVISTYRPDIERKPLTYEQALAAECSEAKKKLQKQMEQRFAKKNHTKAILRRIAQGD